MSGSRPPPAAALRPCAGLTQIDDGAGTSLAMLTQLTALDASDTRLGDAALSTITYGARLAAWSSKTQQPLPPEAQMWPRWAAGGGA